MLRFTWTEPNGKVRTIVTDRNWKATAQTGWRGDSPRRNWAIDYVEIFDMSTAWRGWREVDFDDNAWLKPITNHPATAIPNARFIRRPIPPLVFRLRKPARFGGRFNIHQSASLVEPIASSGALGKSIMSAAWEPAGPPVCWEGDEFTIDGLSPTDGAVLWFDMGAEFVGQVMLECDCPGPGTIDVGWSEVIENDRPSLVRKGVGYVDRIHAVQGRLCWEPIQFSAIRYVVLVARGFHGPVHVRKLRVRTSEPDVKWQGEFHSSDRRLQNVFDMCARSLRVGTQEGQMDCPSREQAPYIADGLLTARWFAQLTGDVRHFDYLVHEQFRRQAPNGLLRGAIFTGCNDAAVDYTLLAVIGLRDYFHFTRNKSVVVELIESCRRALAFFDGAQSNGLCTWAFDRQPCTQHSSRGWENRYDPFMPSFGAEDWFVLFIDHPGLGWHNKNEAGIDRRGTNAALNAFFVLAKRALAELEEVIGNPLRAAVLRFQADEFARNIFKVFFNPAKGMFIDGVQDGEQLSQISEQTNTLAIKARCCDDATARAILEKLLPGNDSAIARNGPYFWAYLFPELARLGVHRLALDRLRSLWGAMVDGGASTLWETFLGDDLDSWCHPWAAAPLEFLWTAVLGLPALDFDERAIVLRPRFDLLAQASGSQATRCGLFSISWSRSGDAVALSGCVPECLEATVEDSTGRRLLAARGTWSADIQIQERSSDSD